MQSQSKSQQVILWPLTNCFCFFVCFVLFGLTFLQYLSVLPMLGLTVGRFVANDSYLLTHFYRILKEHIFLVMLSLCFSLLYLKLLSWIRKTLKLISCISHRKESKFLARWTFIQCSLPWTKLFSKEFEDAFLSL